MLKLSESLVGAPVLSLRTGGPIGVIQRPIIDPDNLKVEGWFVQDRFSKSNLIVLSQDIRDVLPQGIAVNDHEVMTDPDELIRLKPILEINFEIIGKTVTTVSGEKIGKVNDYAVETKSMYIQKIYVGQPLIKSLGGGNLSVDREQVIEVTNRRIVIEDIDKKVRAGATATVPAT